MKTLSLCPHQDLASLKVCQGPVDQPRPPVPDKLVTDMFTNPTAVHLTIKIRDFLFKHFANLVTDMLTNPTVVHLHIELHDFLCNPHCKPCQTCLQSNPISCSTVRENVWILDSPDLTNPISCSIARENALIPNSPDLTNPISCSIARENVWILVRDYKPYQLFNYT